MKNEKRPTTGRFPPFPRGGPQSVHTSNRARRRETLDMKTSTTDKIEGTVKEVKGKIKEQAGKMTGNPDLQDRGTAENLAGKVQKKVGDVKKVLNE